LSGESTHIDTLPARLARLRAALPEAGLDALLISQPENRRYLSGFTGSAGWLLVSSDRALLATDFRYHEQVGLECPGCELVKLQVTFPATLPAMLEQVGGRRIGFEADHVTYADAQAWMEAAPGYEWVPTRGIVIGLRGVKDAEEIATLRAAVKLADEALAAVLSQLRPGMTEREAAWLIDSYMRTHGAEGPSFDTIVAGGPNGARPHAQPTDAPLPAGEPIVIDMGARLHGYCSDLTRTVCLGEPKDPERFWTVYNLVLGAQMAAEATARPGISGKQVDDAARAVIAAGGYGPHFGHSLGHGVGLAVHEEPRFSQAYAGLLVAGATVTVEPGIYLSGWGGVRIEDIVILTGNGAEVLTAAPKEPILAVL
jgi:Xaa-Pro aminopeptidase